MVRIQYECLLNNNMFGIPIWQMQNAFNFNPHKSSFFPFRELFCDFFQRFWVNNVRDWCPKVCLQTKVSSRGKQNPGRKVLANWNMSQVIRFLLRVYVCSFVMQVFIACGFCDFLFQLLIYRSYQVISPFAFCMLNMKSQTFSPLYVGALNWHGAHGRMGSTTRAFTRSDVLNKSFELCVAFL